jgi:hypothetical protein
MSRKLNSRQMQFATNVAAGKSLVSAYREVYQPANAKAPSVYQNAKRSAKHPGIAARIRELQVELLPAPADMKAIYAHGLAVMIQLSITSEDARVRLRAAEWLCAEAEKREKLEAVQPRNQHQLDKIFSELHDLYRKAPTQEPLVEVVSDEEPERVPGGEVLEPPDESSAAEAPWNREGVEEAARTTDVLFPAGCTKEAFEGKDLEMPEPSTGHNATEAEAPIGAGFEGPAPEVKFELVAIPGRFPRQFRLQQRRG